MKTKILVISEDLTPVSTLSGFLGKFYYQSVKIVQQFNLFIIGRIFYRNKVELLLWDKNLSQNKLDKERRLAWQIVDKKISPLFQNLSYSQVPLVKVWGTILAIYISQEILAYQQALDRVLQTKPGRLIILGSSNQAQIAGLIARQQGLKIIRWPCLNFSRINRFLLNWLFARQIKLRLKTCLSFTEAKPIQIKSGCILLAASFFRHLKTLLPLHQALEGRNLNSFIIWDAVGTKQALDRQGIPAVESIGLLSQVSLSNRELIYHEKLQQGKNHWRSLKNYFYRQPENIEALSIRLMKGYLKTLSTRIYPLACLYLQAAENLIVSQSPRAIVLVSDARPLEVALGLMARKYHCLSILVSPNTVLSLDAVNQYLLTDKVTVVGPHLKKQLISIGVPDKKIHLVGDLRFESLNLEKLQNSFYRKLKLPPKLKLFLLISFRHNPLIPLQEKKHFFQIAASAVQRIPGSCLLIKPHPTESSKNIKKQINEWGIKQAIITDNNQLELLELLSVSQATLITWSMSGFESLQLKVPVVVINPSGKDYDKIIPYVQDGGACLAKNAEELFTILQQRQFVKGQNFIQKYILKPDGQSAERIIRLIYS